VNAGAIASVTRDFRGQAHVKVKGKDEALVVSRSTRTFSSRM
jgi:DNA-binding LytR/AlgR family response regulator